MKNRLEIEQYLAMGDGCLAQSKVSTESTEAEVRTAISRAYYALLHCCSAFLLLKNAQRENIRYHDRVRKEILRIRGAEAAKTFETFYALRKEADYNPRMFQDKPYYGDLALFRALAESRISDIKTEFEKYAAEVRGYLAKKT